MIIDAQLGLLEVGITPRACKVQAPSFIIRFMTGACAFRMPSGLIPSQPMMIRCLGAAICARAPIETPNVRDMKPIHL